MENQKQVYHFPTAPISLSLQTKKQQQAGYRPPPTAADHNGLALPPPDEPPPGEAAGLRAFREHPAGAFAMRLFAEER